MNPLDTTHVIPITSDEASRHGRLGCWRGPLDTDMLSQKPRRRSLLLCQSGDASAAEQWRVQTSAISSRQPTTAETGTRLRAVARGRRAREREGRQTQADRPETRIQRNNTPRERRTRPADKNQGESRPWPRAD